jgi:uncharacterized protein
LCSENLTISMQTIISYISHPWPWYIAGPLIGLVIILLQWIDNKPLAASSSYRHVCSAAFPNGIPFLINYNWKAESWNLFFVAGITIGSFYIILFISALAGTWVYSFSREKLLR